jgi:hypothetical protein
MRASLLIIACSASLPNEARHEAIIGGTRDSGDPAVVMLVAYPPDQSTAYTCTASLIAPSLLITAAHCVDHPGDLFGAFPGDDASTYTTTPALVSALVPATAAHIHPQYNRSPPFDADIAVVELSVPLAAAPLPFARQAPSAGQAARIVGYGETVYPNYNAAKYQADTVVSSLPGDDTVVVGDAQRHTCVGDSGGPALVMMGGVETVIGADSYTDTTGCTQPSHYRRTDLYTAFIDPYLPAPPPDLSAPPDLSTRDLSARDLSGVPDLSSSDLSTRPDLSAPAVSSSAGGCQAAPGSPSWPIAVTLLGCCFWLSRRRW